MLTSKIIINQSTATIRKLIRSLQRRSILNTFLMIILHYYTHFGCTLEWKYSSPVEPKFHHKNSSECKLVYYNGWICDWARWSKSCVLMGTPIYSGFPALVCHIINPLRVWFIMAGYWPCFFLCIFIKLDFVSVTKNAKKRTWPIPSHHDLKLSQ